MSTPDQIGHETCLRGLRARHYVPEVVLDIGAAHGAWTVAALQIWWESRYFLFEALAECEPELAALKGNCSNVDYRIQALAAAPGVRTFGVTEQSDASSFAWPGSETARQRGKEWKERSIETTTLDAQFAAGLFPQPNVLKLDVQGYEIEILNGGQKVLRGADLVLLELQFFRFSERMPLMHEAIAYMAARRFYPYEVVDVLRRPFDGAMGQCDLMFCREGHWLNSYPQWE